MGIEPRKMLKFEDIENWTTKNTKLLNNTCFHIKTPMTSSSPLTASESTQGPECNTYKMTFILKNVIESFVSSQSLWLLILLIVYKLGANLSFLR